MNKSTRYALCVLGTIIVFHYILTLSDSAYSPVSSVSTIVSHFHGVTGGKDLSYPQDHVGLGSPTLSQVVATRRANASFVILARNSDIDGTVQSIRALEDRFNSRHGYPYVLLNEVPFTEDFRRRGAVLTSSTIEFGIIPKEHWYQPQWIDEQKATSARNRMMAANVKYGGTYRNMCRFNSGFFFQHELLQKYRWYWRVEPNIHYHCDINHDPFLFMEDNDKVYSFTITVREIPATIPTLWGHVKDFIKEHPEFVAPDNAMGFLSHNGGETYNTCHFWSNFEIADMDFWRGPAYTAFFKYLDSTGGFYYERWGDAPIHSIAAGLFARKEQIHFFEEIGYQHDDWSHCPLDGEIWTRGRCSCNQKQSFDYDVGSCKRQWDDFMRKTVPH